LYSSFYLPIDPNLLLKRQQRRIHLLRFLKESLLDLQKQFDELDIEKEKEVGEGKFSISSKLTFLLGDPVSTIKKIIQADKQIEAVFVNRDYSTFSIERDRSIKEICKSINIEFIECPDILINEPEELLNCNNQPFKVFFNIITRQLKYQ
jgi:deoxyribodipyrimidine photo-lyase